MKQANNPALAVTAWAAANSIPTGTVPRGRVKRNGTNHNIQSCVQPDGGLRLISITLPRGCRSCRVDIHFQIEELDAVWLKVGDGKTALIDLPNMIIR